ncbi:class I SAM-dependent methyltransferase [Undibacterium sp. TJN19]|uniref:class I SAM-dependent methyltransferase n=1 Tax=Undibacterium sp. TJN19 TaxID=3413055 RepID=UPI003BF329BF
MKTTQASNTALIVAAGVQMLARDPDYRGLVPKTMSEPGQRLLSASHPHLDKLIQHGWFHWLIYAAEKMTLPGILLHYVLRKTVIREYVAASINAGTRQIVLTGAGYDSLCMELAGQYQGLTLIEIDHPATQAVKRRALGATSATPATSTAFATPIHYIAAELGRQNLAEVLSSFPVFDPHAKTLFIAEGLLMYLTNKDVCSLLKQIRDAAASVSLIFTWMEIQADGRPNFRPPSKVIDFFLAHKAEPFLSGMPQAQLASFLQQNGFDLQGLKESVAALPSHYMATPAMHPIAGEYICLAESPSTHKVSI